MNISLVGQHATLFLTGTPSLLNTVAPHERVSRTGKVAREVTVSEMSASALAASSLVGNIPMTSPICRRAANDGRSGKTRRLNVEFGMSTTVSLPPSTGSFRSINVERM